MVVGQRATLLLPPFKFKDPRANAAEALVVAMETVKHARVNRINGESIHQQFFLFSLSRATQCNKLFR